MEERLTLSARCPGSSKKPATPWASEPKGRNLYRLSLPGKGQKGRAQSRWHHPLAPGGTTVGIREGLCHRSVAALPCSHPAALQATHGAVERLQPAAELISRRAPIGFQGGARLVHGKGLAVPAVGAATRRYGHVLCPFAG